MRRRLARPRELPGGAPPPKPVEWRCWELDSPIPEARRRIGGPKSVVAQTAYFARHAGGLEFKCDPQCVDVEISEEKKLNGKGDKDAKKKK